MWAREPEDVSLLHVLFYIHSAGGLDALLDTEGGAQEDRFVGGSQLIALGWPRSSATACVLGAPVRRIEQRAATA